MSRVLLTQADVAKKLQREVERCGSQEKLGLEWHLSPPLISFVVSGKKTPGPLILDALGLEKVVFYRKKEN